MPKTTDSVIFSDIERTILETALQNPDLSNAEIAEETGARITLVRDTRANYEDEVELAEDVADEGDDVATPTAVDDAELTETQVAIIEALADDSSQTNAEIADRTGTRMALVRDTRDEYGDAIEASAESADESADDGTDTLASTESPEPSETQEEILALAEQNPELTNAEIAEETGARMTLVRDTRNEFDLDAGRSDSGAENAASDTDLSTDIEAEAFSETQVEILETAAANPELTNAEIAAETGTRITLVRDTIREHESDGESESDSSADEPTTTDDDTDVLADVDTSAFSGAQLDILETALSNPELTNGEIAERTGSRIALVRDTLYEHEYDDKPWDKDFDDEDDEDDAAEEATPTEEPVEMPETTDSELLSDAERAILEAALENPELTNGEIAEQTGSRLTLVRDTRATYEAAVDLPVDDSDNADDTGTAATDTTGEPSERQREILDAIGANPERTNAEIAAETDARITFVRDTRTAYGDDIEVADTADTDDGTSAAGAEDAASDSDTGSTETTDTAETTETAAAEPSAEPSSSNTGLIVAVLLLILVIVALALL